MKFAGFVPLRSTKSFARLRKQETSVQANSRLRYLTHGRILQEIILRSALQHSLIHFLTGRFAKTRIIATTTLITAATHLHMKSLVFPLLIIIPNIFRCMLYDKHRFLLCVSVSHIPIGVWALFVLGQPWQ